MDFFITLLAFFSFTSLLLVVRGLFENPRTVNLIFVVLGGYMLILLYLFVALRSTLDPWLIFPGILVGIFAGHIFGASLVRKIKGGKK